MGRRCNWCNKILKNPHHSRRYCNNKCLKEYLKVRNKRYYQEHINYFKKHNDDYRKEKSKEIKIYKKQYYDKNREIILKKNIDNYQKNKERFVAEARKYRENHREIVNQTAQRWRDKKEKKEH